MGVYFEGEGVGGGVEGEGVCVGGCGGAHDGGVEDGRGVGEGEIEADAEGGEGDEEEGDGAAGAGAGWGVDNDCGGRLVACAGRQR